MNNNNFGGRRSSSRPRGGHSSSPRSGGNSSGGFNHKSKSGGNSGGGNRGGGGRSRFGGNSNGNRGGNSRPRYGGGSRSRGNGRKQKNNGLHPDMYILPAQHREEESIYADGVKYTDFAISGQIKKNLEHLKYSTPTKIQNLAIPAALEGRDVLAQASTGSGKTAAFLIPMLNKMLVGNSRERCLIVLPTRELAQQTEVELRKLAYGTKIKSTIIIGGASMGMQKKSLRTRPDFVIATPGRLKDLFTQGAIDLSDFNNVVLDEVDRMLDMGFIQDIKFIISKLEDDRQSIFVSATMDKKSEELATELLQDPVNVKVSKQAPQANVDQDAVKIPKGTDKVRVLHELLIQEEFEKVLVFSRTKHGAERLSDKLNQMGHRTDSIHGNKSQSKRTRVIERYRKSQIKVLVATDVVARGLDIKDITHVINYDEPGTYEDYIHRIGRTGRIGKTGVALTFVEQG